MATWILAEDGKWAVATDNHQWILQRRNGQKWYSVSFVSSTKDVLERCMREKGADAATIKNLTWELPESFDQFKTTVA